ncbi:MAG: sulfatase-like hydrolase/transferase [Ruminiclostridium sp.]|nr:sulfatase-like hydrolase/transferase [Ruminiclostridium sp.]
MFHQSKRSDTMQEGKAIGLSFRACILPQIPLALSWLILDVNLRYTFQGTAVVGAWYLPAFLFTFGWILVLTGLVIFLPGRARSLARWLPTVVFGLLTLTHSAFMNVFRRFFSVAALTFSGVGDFVETDYIQFHPPILWAFGGAVVLTFLSGRLQKRFPLPRGKKPALLGLAAVVAGGCVIAGVHFLYFPKMDTVVWENTDKDAAAAAYQDYTNSTNALMVSGLYQYTVRDLWICLRPAGSLSQEEEQAIDGYIAEYEAGQAPNEYTGLLAGKNLILVQLEAIDTWMLSKDYMPNLWQVKQESLSFTNHYTPAYITAGTFNTEFIANSGLLPATGGIPTSVYTRDSYPYSLANLFAGAGYTCRSFHGSEGTVYDRENIHKNLGYESYHGGQSMAMEVYMMDRYLMNGFETMTEGDPFFSFLITYSGHGPYGEDSGIYQAHADDAQRLAGDTEGNYVYAVAGAMETDQFVGEFMAKLEQTGLAEDTVVVFYADHYNYYMMNDALNMQIKGVDNMNMLQHTDFFIWSRDLEAGQVDKVTSTLDVLPTLANLFGLDTTGAFLPGHDGLGDQGGYVFFNDGSWYDGEVYWSSGSGDGGDPEKTAQINRIMSLNNSLLAGDYYGRK